MDAPRTHYQISLTARQAVGLFAALLIALGLSFFFGLEAGMAGRSPKPPAGEAVAAMPARAETPEPIPRVETAVPTVAFSGGSRTVLAPASGGSTPQAEPTVPATLQPFDDRSSDEPAESAASTATSAPAPAPPAGTTTGHSAPSTAGKYWVQVASLTSREEAGSLQSRLSRHGFHAQVAPTEGAHGKGKVYRVRVGPYVSEPEAQKVATRLAKQEKLKGPWVVPEGK